MILSLPSPLQPWVPDLRCFNLDATHKVQRLSSYWLSLLYREKNAGYKLSALNLLFFFFFLFELCFCFVIGGVLNSIRRYAEHRTTKFGILTSFSSKQSLYTILFRL